MLLKGRDTVTMKRPQVLFVDDDPRILRSLQATFKLKYTVLTAEDAMTAQALLEQQGPVDVIVSDERMPKISGHAFLAWSKEHFPKSTRILLSGFADKASLGDKVNDADVFRFVSKPWDMKYFEVTLDEAVTISASYVEKNSTISRLSTERQVNTSKNIAAKPSSVKDGAKTTCSFAILDDDPLYQEIFQKIGDNIANISNLIICHSLQELADVVSQTPELGIVCIDLSVGQSEILKALGEFAEINPNLQVLLTAYPAFAKKYFSLTDTSTNSSFMVKPMSVNRLQPRVQSLINSYLSS